MTQKQIAFKKSLIKNIHISKRYTNYYKEEREEYESLLLEHFGVRSSKELNIKQLVALLDYFNYNLPELPIIRDRSKDASKKQIVLLIALWQRYARDKSVRALLYFTKSITGVLFISLEAIPKKEISKVINALKKNLGEK